MCSRGSKGGRLGNNAAALLQLGDLDAVVRGGRQGAAMAEPRARVGIEDRVRSAWMARTADPRF